MISFESEVTQSCNVVAGFKMAALDQTMVDLSKHDPTRHSTKVEDLRTSARDRVRKHFAHLKSALGGEIVTAQKATESTVPFTERTYYAMIAGQDVAGRSPKELLALYEEVARSGNRAYLNELGRVIAPSLLASDLIGSWETLRRQCRSPEEMKADKIAAENISVLKQLQGVEAQIQQSLDAAPTDALVPDEEDISPIAARIRENATREGASA